MSQNDALNNAFWFVDSAFSAISANAEYAAGKTLDFAQKAALQSQAIILAGIKAA